MMRPIAAAALLALAPGAAGAAPPAPSPADVAYEARVVDLSRVLGGAHYIRVLCRGRGDQAWRQAMSDLIALEAPGPGALHAAMVEAFNDGYRTEEVRFPACGPDAEAVEADLKTKGRRLTAALAASHRPD